MKKVVFIIMSILAISFVWGKPKSKKAAPQKAVPEWLENPQNIYPAGKYLYAIGEGKSRAQAENAAVANLAAIFKQNVNLNVASQRKMDSKGGTSESIQMASRRITKLEDLIGAQIKDAYQNGSNWSAIAVIDKQESSNMYRSAIEKSDIDVKNTMADIAKTDYGNYSIENFLALNKAYVMAQKNEVSLDRLGVLNATLAGELRGGVTTSSEVFELLTAASNATPIFVTSGDDRYTAAIKSAISDLGLQTADDANTRYSILVDAIFQNLATRDGKSVNSNWSLTISLKDGPTTIYSYNKSGRSGGVDETGAQLKADNAIIAILKGDFVKDFTKYLTGDSK